MTEHLASWLFTYALHSTLLLGAAWLVTTHVARAHAVKDVIWKTALVGGLVTASLQAGLGVRPLGGLLALSPAAVETGRAMPVARAAEKPAKSESAVPTSGPIFNLQRVADPAPTEAGHSAPAPTRGMSALARFRDLSPTPALYTWAIIAGALLLIYLSNRLRLIYRLGARHAVSDLRLMKTLDRLRQEAGMRRHVALTAAPGLASPVALGSSEIALPEAALTDLGPDAQDSMLAHELAHLSRRDPQWLTLTCIIERVFFFQPLNRLARVRIQEAAEFLCDDWAARRTGSGLVLARCLVKVAEWIDTSPQPVPLSAMAERRSQLVSRIHRLIENHAMRPQPRRIWLVPAAVVLVLVTALAVPGISTVPISAQQAEGTDTTVTDTSSSFESAVRHVQMSTREIERRAMRQAELAMRRVRTTVNVHPVVAPHIAVPAVPATAFVAPAVEVNLNRALVEAKMADVALQGLRGGKTRGDTTGAAVPALIAALKDTDVEVRRAAASSLGNFQDPRAVLPLVDALRDSDAEVREHAADALGDMQDPRAIPGLTAALKDSSPEVRRRAICGLNNMDGKKPVDAFILALADSNAEVRQAAIDAVADAEDKRAVRPLIKLLSDPSADVRHSAAHALGSIADPSAAEALAAALRDTDSDVRGAAASSLSDLGLTVAPPALLEATKDKKADVRQMAAESLGEIRDPKSVPTLRVLLNDPNADVREAAINALSEVRDSAALDALIGALKSTDPTVRRQAAEALGQRSDNGDQ
jgi:HEAT repeat protein/beta-lactamase regulating signal transducer with metallopeptidase domain